MRILTTGGAGRLGSELVRLIASNGHEAVALDLPNAQWGAVENVQGTEILIGDITDPRFVDKACHNIDRIIHLAALLPPKCEVSKELTYRVNVEGTRNIVDVLKKTRTPIIFSSSISTYGITAFEEPPLNEDRPQRAHNFYSGSKINAERLIRSSDLPYIILRIAPIAVADLVELPDIIPYKENQRVEFVYAADAAQALFEAVMNPRALGKTFNIAGGSSWQMMGAEYIAHFYGALGVEVDPVFSEVYTALDWYDTSRSRFLDYPRTSFNDFLGKLRVLAEELGLV